MGGELLVFAQNLRRITAIQQRAQNPAQVLLPLEVSRRYILGLLSGRLRRPQAESDTQMRAWHALSHGPDRHAMPNQQVVCHLKLPWFGLNSRRMLTTSVSQKRKHPGLVESRPEFDAV